MKYYNLTYKNKSCSGIYFYDTNFGLFFITEKLTDKLLRYESVELIANEENIICNVKGNLNYKVCRINNEDSSYIYVFASLDDTLKDKVIYTTLDELYNVSESMYSASDVLNYLSKFEVLPNGNYLVSSVQDYITAIEDLQKKYPDKEAFYRGQYRFDFNLTPSLFRKKKYYDNELLMYMDFKTQFYNELSNKKYIEILTTMQHYNMPTRLLDTTSNPLVALFMACDKPTGIKNKGVTIGEVVVMNEDRKNVKYSDSNSITIISSLAVLESKYKYELYDKISESIAKNDPSIYKDTISYKRFKAEIVSTLPSFNEEFFDPTTLLNPVHVKVGMINERIIAQSGSFILFGLCDYKTLQVKPLNTISKERVFIVNGENIKKQLEMLNISAATMFPDKDHMAATIKKMYD